MMDIARSLKQDYRQEVVAEKLRQGFGNESKMAELAVELRLKRSSKSADTIDRFSQDIWNHRAFSKAREGAMIRVFVRSGYAITKVTA
jgi:hypothetical protein